MPPPSGRWSTTAAAGLSRPLAASAGILDAWDVPVAALNRVLPEHGDDDPTWWNVLLASADLAEYKVS